MTRYSRPLTFRIALSADSDILRKRRRNDVDKTATSRIEVNFPEIFLDYRERKIDCILFSSFPEDPTFEILARGHAAAHNY
jgi:hypothetical protein